jgi:dTDP-4-dehydrorhamnose reductase
MLNVLQFGKTGQVARALTASAPAAGVRIRALSRFEADLADPDACAAAILEAGPVDAVINAAAYTAVDQAEADEAAARVINAASPGAMSRACAVRGVPFLHLSTDYVFGGRAGRAYIEDDATNPLSAYGRSKLAGEQAVLDAGGCAVILRTSWVFSSQGKNFVRTMLRLASMRNELDVVDDQRGGPTAASDIAEALLTIVRACAAGRGHGGVFHYCGAPVTTWRHFAEAIFALALPAQRRPRVRPIRTEEYPTPAVRPRDSALACGKIMSVFGIAQPRWERSLQQVIAQLAMTEEGIVHA